VLDDLDPGIEGEDLELCVAQPLIGLARDVLALVPPDLHRAGLLEQRVLEPAVEIGEALVLLVPDPVDVVGRLVGGVLVLRSGRVEADDLVARGEDAHQRRHHAVDGLGDVVRDDLAAPLDLVAEDLALVIALGLKPLLRQPPALIAERVVDLGVENGGEVAVGHFRHAGDPSARRAEARARRRGERSNGRMGAGHGALNAAVPDGEISLLLHGFVEGSESAGANPEHAQNDVFLSRICQEKNSVSEIF
jgi:hypothetical protein